MKTILAIWHSAEKGKTETIREFAKLLIEKYNIDTDINLEPILIPTKADFRLIVNINGKVVGIESQGDPGTGLKDRLIVLADLNNCDIIICSTRTKGETIDAVDNLHYNYGFQTIWTSTYQIAKESEQKLANKLKAKHIIDLLQTLELI